MEDVALEMSSAGTGQARTRRARAAVLVAAGRLLVDDGYVATTIAGISKAAGIPIATVYRLFPTKVDILKAVLDVAIAGDAQDVPVASRPTVGAAISDPDPHAHIVGFATVTASINQRIAAIYRVLLNAADADPAAAVYLGELTAQRQNGQGLLANSLATSGSLKPDLDEQDATDIIHALMSPEVYRMLVHDRGWQPERYRNWLAGTLTQQLMISSA